MTFEYLKYVLPMRRRFQAMGRTVFNRPRISTAKPRPQLRGLNLKDYRRLYMRIRRQEISQ